MNSRKAIFIVPLMSTVISTLLFTGYALSLTLDIYRQKNVDITFGLVWDNLFTIFPFVSFIMLLISYLFYIPFLAIGKKIQYKYFLSEKTLWAIMFGIGLFLSAIVGGFMYQSDGLLGKYIIIILSGSLGFLFNTSLFSVLTGKIKKPETL